MIDKSKLPHIEWIARGLMALILLTAGISKFFSNGGFKDYYAGLFANPDLRINIPPALIELYLTLIPFIEVGLGLCLLIPMLKPKTVYAWYAFMASLLVGHYLLQEWMIVNQMLAYFFLGMICHILPTKRELSASSA
jgi:uncharacterized membrane protein YphA (DoxX/SURF4 family)